MGPYRRRGRTGTPGPWVATSWTERPRRPERLRAVGRFLLVIFVPWSTTSRLSLEVARVPWAQTRRSMSCGCYTIRTLISDRAL